MVRRGRHVLVYQHEPVDMGDIYVNQARHFGTPRLLVLVIPAAPLLQWTLRSLSDVEGAPGPLTGA